jgi:TolA-binding protein
MVNATNEFARSSHDAVDRPIAEQLSELRQRLDDLNARLPAHSAPPSMVAQMEELEEEIARLQALLSGDAQDAPGQAASRSLAGA